jgi:hypothetical protein
MIDDDKTRKETAVLRQGIRLIEHSQDRRERASKYADLGLCGKCEWLHAETTKYGTRRHWCTDLRRGVSIADPIVDCTNYVEAGKLPLSLLMQMAVPIEVERKRKIGFSYNIKDDADPDTGDYEY